MKTKLKLAHLAAALAWFASPGLMQAQDIEVLGITNNWPVPDFLSKDTVTGVPPRLFTIGYGIGLETDAVPSVGRLDGVFDALENTIIEFDGSWADMGVNPGTDILPNGNLDPDVLVAQVLVGEMRATSGGLEDFVRFPSTVTVQPSGGGADIPVSVVAYRGGYYRKSGTTSSSSVDLSASKRLQGASEQCGTVLDPLSAASDNASVDHVVNSPDDFDAANRLKLWRRSSRTAINTSAQPEGVLNPGELNAVRGTIFDGNRVSKEVINLNPQGYENQGLLLDNFIVAGGNASSSEDIELDGAVFRGSGVGGGIFVGTFEDSFDLHLNSILFYKNEANLAGGAIYFNRANVGLGGADEVVSRARVSISNSSFVRNRVISGDGGAIWSGLVNPDNRLHIMQTTFDGNRSSSGFGGAVKITGSLPEGGGESIFVSNIFYDNSATLTGGAVFADNHSITAWLNNTFAQNTTDAVNGGAIFFAANAALLSANQTRVFHNNVFLENSTGLGSTRFQVAHQRPVGNPLNMFANHAMESLVSTINEPDPELVLLADADGNDERNVVDVTLTPYVSNTANLRGPDGVLGTLDDGLRPNAASVLVNEGDMSIFDDLTRPYASTFPPRGRIFDLPNLAGGVANRISHYRNYRWGYTADAQQIVDVYMNANFDDRHFDYVRGVLEHETDTAARAAVAAEQADESTHDPFWRFGLDVVAQLPEYHGTEALEGADWWYYQRLSYRVLNGNVDIGAYEYRSYDGEDPFSFEDGIVYVDDNAPGDPNGVHDGSSWMSAYLFVEDAILRAALDPRVVEVRIAQPERAPARTGAVADGVLWQIAFENATSYSPGRPSVQTVTVGDVEWNALTFAPTCPSEVQVPYALDNRDPIRRFLPYATPSYFTPDRFAEMDVALDSASLETGDFGRTYLRARTPLEPHRYMRLLGASRVIESVSMTDGADLAAEVRAEPSLGVAGVRSAVEAAVEGAYTAMSVNDRLNASRSAYYRFNLDSVGALSGNLTGTSDASRGLALKGGYFGWRLSEDLTEDSMGVLNPGNPGCANWGTRVGPFGIFDPTPLDERIRISQAGDRITVNFGGMPAAEANRWRDILQPGAVVEFPDGQRAVLLSAVSGTGSAQGTADAVPAGTQAAVTFPRTDTAPQLARFITAYNRGWADWSEEQGNERDIIDLETVLSGDLAFLNDDDHTNSQRILQSTNALYSRIDGLTIRKADARVEGFDGFGAGIFLGTTGGDRAEMLLIDAKVIHNMAFYGGGIYVDSAYLHTDVLEEPVDRTLIGENFAVHAGGGIFVRGSSQVHLYNTTVQYNTAKDRDDRFGVYTYGGGVAAGPGVIMDVFNANIIANVAGFGAGFDLDNVALTQVQNSMFIANWAHWWGGAIFMQNDYTEENLYNYVVCTSLFTGNRAAPPFEGSYDPTQPPRGGAIYSYNSQASISHSTFYENSSPYGPAWIDDVAPILIGASPPPNANPGGTRPGGIFPAPIIPRMEVFNSIIAKNKWYIRDLPSVEFVRVPQFDGRVRIDGDHPFYHDVNDVWEWAEAHNNPALGIVWSLVEADDFYYGDPELGPRVILGDPQFDSVNELKGPRGLYYLDYHNPGADGMTPAPLNDYYITFNEKKGEDDYIFGTPANDGLGFRVTGGRAQDGSTDVFGNAGRHMGVYAYTPDEDPPTPPVFPDVDPSEVLDLEPMYSSWYYSHAIGGQVWWPTDGAYFYSRDLGWSYLAGELGEGFLVYVVSTEEWFFFWSGVGGDVGQPVVGADAGNDLWFGADFQPWAYNFNESVWTGGFAAPSEAR